MKRCSRRRCETCPNGRDNLVCDALDFLGINEIHRFIKRMVKNIKEEGIE